MALPSSGQITLAQMSDEFGGGSRSNVSLRTLSAAAGLSVPDGFNEMYGLSAYTPPSYVSGASSITGAGTAANPYYITLNSFTSFSTSEDYALCEYSGFGELVDWIGYYIGSVRFQFSQTGSQKATMQVTSFNTNMCTNGGLYSYATIQLSQSYFLNSSFWEFSTGNKYFGDNQNAKDKMLNKVYTTTCYSYMGPPTIFDLFFQTQQSPSMHYDSDCDGYYEETLYSNCANLTLSSIVVKLYFEPV